MNKKFPTKTRKGNIMLGYENSHIRTHKGGIALIVVIVISLLLSGCAGTQQPKVYKVGILYEAATMGVIADGFKAKMTELGYIEGQNIVYLSNAAYFNSSEEQRILKQYTDEKVDLIFAFPTEAATAAKAYTQGTNIPVIFAQSMIEGNDLVKSVQQPGGNITGVRDPGPDVTVKRLEIYHELAPQVKRIYIPYDMDFPAIPPVLEVLRPAASSLGIELVELNAKDITAIQADLEARNSSGDIGMDAIMTLGQPLTSQPDVFALLSGFAAEHNIPIGGIVQNDNARNVFVYEPAFSEIGGLAAPLADKIFKGISAGTIPVVTPEAYLMINYKLAKELGIEVPEGLLNQASEIIR
jgi:putative ABC transport system substrate-binding protein